MNKFKPTFDFQAYRIHDVSKIEAPDFTAFYTVVVSSIREPKSRMSLQFLVEMYTGPIPSLRFGSLVKACRLTVFKDIDDLFGRAFAMKDGGVLPEDFADLEYASACLQSDRKAFTDANAYAAKCAAEEAAEKAGFANAS